ncbi:hypothetical protein NUW58_g4624 [Xylaria curta]|uniref:Uncharacterized protein n=1 Tax=Xylaria curta TaxID=42375 RepID=A0ACC1P6W0_9PEZI|nr:hypothetical protein NUW58_g4624 [Xylaria curta]
MDDTTTLVSELLNKLADLDQKVYNYRQDMANEFQRYSRHLLHDVPEHVSTQVEEAVADKLHNYSALSPAFALDSASADLGRSAVGRWTRRRTGSRRLRELYEAAGNAYARPLAGSSGPSCCLTEMKNQRCQCCRIPTSTISPEHRITHGRLRPSIGWASGSPQPLTSVTCV